jgi:hypothetical protein
MSDETWLSISNSSLSPQNMACLGCSPFLLQRSVDGSNFCKGQICNFDDNTISFMTTKITEKNHV